MNKREAMIEANRQAAGLLRQHVDSAVEGVMESEADSDKVAAALEKLAQRHDRAVKRLTDTGSRIEGNDTRA